MFGNCHLSQRAQLLFAKTRYVVSILESHQIALQSGAAIVLTTMEEEGHPDGNDDYVGASP